MADLCRSMRRHGAVLLGISLAFGLVSCSTSVTNGGPSTEDDSFYYYRVTQADLKGTIWALLIDVGKKYNARVSEIIKANDNQFKNGLLAPGSILKIPKTGSVTSGYENSKVSVSDDDGNGTKETRTTTYYRGARLVMSEIDNLEKGTRSRVILSGEGMVIENYKNIDEPECIVTVMDLNHVEFFRRSNDGSLVPVSTREWRKMKLDQPGLQHLNEHALP